MVGIAQVFRNKIADLERRVEEKSAEIERLRVQVKANVPTQEAREEWYPNDWDWWCGWDRVVKAKAEPTPSTPASQATRDATKPLKVTQGEWCANGQVWDEIIRDRMERATSSTPDELLGKKDEEGY